MINSILTSITGKIKRLIQGWCGILQNFIKVANITSDKYNMTNISHALKLEYV